MPGFILNDGAVVPPSVYSAMNTVLNKKLGTTQVYSPRDWAAIVKDLVPLPLKSASGSIAHFDDGADTVPLKSLTYRFTPTQAGSGDPSPSNPRAINSVSSVNVTSAGKNLFPASKVAISTRNNMTYANSVFVKQGNYMASISNLENATSWRFCFRIYDLNGNIVTSAKTNGYVSSTALADTYDSNQTLMQGANSTLTNIPIEILKDCYIACGLSSGDVSGSTTFDYQLEVGSVATTFAEYSAPTLTPVSLGQTVYGGEGNEAGEFTSTYKLADLSTMDWDSGAPNQDGYIRFVNHSAWGDKANGYKLFCDKFPVKTSLIPSSPTTIGISGYTSNANIYIAVESSMLTGDLSTNAGRNTAFRNWISDNGLQIIYELATPTALSVDPVAISSRLGANNIYLDLEGSEIECEYYADPTLSTL